MTAAALSTPLATLRVMPSRAEWLALRRNYIGASDVAALLGVHPFKTAYRLWLEKTGRYVADDGTTPQLDRGRRLEPIALDLLAEERPTWRVEPNPIPGGTMVTDDRRRMAATPDAFAIDPERGRGICQVKSVEPHIYREQWTDDGEVILPTHVAVQANAEAALTGSQWAAAATLVVEHGITLEVFDVPIVPELMPRFEDAVADFWRLVEKDEEPPIDYGRDLDLLKRFGPREVAGMTLHFDDDREFCEAARAHRDLARQIRTAKKDLRELEALLRDKMGEASLGLAEGIRVTFKTQRRPEQLVKASEFRVLRVAGGRAVKQEEDDE